MQRGFDTLQTPVGVALVTASILFLIGVSIWGGFFFKRLVKKDETARKNHRENKNN